MSEETRKEKGYPQLVKKQNAPAADLSSPSIPKFFFLNFHSHCHSVFYFILFSCLFSSFHLCQMVEALPASQLQKLQKQSPLSVELISKTQSNNPSTSNYVVKIGFFKVFRLLLMVEHCLPPAGPLAYFLSSIINSALTHCLLCIHLYVCRNVCALRLVADCDPCSLRKRQ